MNDLNSSSIRMYLIYLMSIVGVITLVGASGFRHFEMGHNPNVKGFWDCVWWTMVTLTTIGYGDIYPYTLGGRIIAILLMFIGIGILGVSTAAIAAYFVNNDQLQLLRIRNIKNHVVVCGLGQKGFLLVKAFRDRGDAVLVVDQNPSNDLIQPCKELGAFVLIGDATEPEMLAKARVPEAKYLIAVTGEDGSNAEIAAHARALLRSRSRRPLTCVAHIVDTELWFLLRKWEVSSAGAFRLQFFNVYDLGARAMLTIFPPFERADLGPGQTPHLLVAGGGRLGLSVVVHAARLWRETHAREKLRFTIIDQDVSRLKDELSLRLPGILENCEIETLSMRIPSPEFHKARFLYDDDLNIAMTAIYLCLRGDSINLSAALALSHHVPRQNVPIIVRMNQDAGLATLLQDSQGEGKGANNLYAFGLLERTCQPDLVLGGTNEVLARSIHEQYLADQKKAGKTLKDNPALASWEKLPEEIKESNRRQADHIGLKLQTIGCDIAPLTEWNARSFSFTPEEVEKMARLEHERWVAERQSEGWTYGPRDNVKKTNPNLVKWEELPEESRKFNRDVILGLPDALAHAGLQIYRFSG
jgi:voltage-gated potassium channel Kch